jgi:hypothetical protein
MRFDFPIPFRVYSLRDPGMRGMTALNTPYIKFQDLVLRNQIDGQGSGR